jgi:hypothetical protein
VYKLIQTTSSALAAASLLAAALGFAVIGKPLRADEPLNGSFCGDCQSDDCPECPGEGDSTAVTIIWTFPFRVLVFFFRRMPSVHVPPRYELPTAWPVFVPEPSSSEQPSASDRSR